jgi:hypothetical protein
MSVAKITVTMEKELLAHPDHLVARQEKPSRARRSRFARECAKLDPAFERALAEQCLSRNIQEWPEY